MQHCRSTHTGPHICRTGGQISKSLIKGEVEFAFERCVDLVDELKCLFQLKTRTNGLHPKMIFFVDHNTQRLPPIDYNRTACALGGMSTTDQVAFDQHLLV